MASSTYELGRNATVLLNGVIYTIFVTTCKEISHFIINGTKVPSSMKTIALYYIYYKNIHKSENFISAK